MEDRYIRQIQIPNFGKAGQLALSNANVLVVGCGGLGCPVAMNLSRSGVKTLGLVDSDLVDISNLHRQTLFNENDIGSLKVEAAKQALISGNSDVDITTFSLRLTPKNYANIIKAFDIVVDCTDNFDTRYLINDACVWLHKTLVYGAANRLEGQVAVFNHNGSGNLRDLYPDIPLAGTIQNCEEAGVLGAITGVIGNLMALEVIKLITMIGQPLINQLLQYDGFTSRIHVINYTRNLGLVVNEPKEKRSAISWDEYNANYTAYQLIDVRSYSERMEYGKGGIHLPLDELSSNGEALSEFHKIAFYCQSGQRAQQALSMFSNNQGAEVIAIADVLTKETSR